MKKKFLIAIILFFVLNIYAEELTGFFGYNIGDSLEKFKTDEIFDLLYEYGEMNHKFYSFSPWDFSCDYKKSKAKTINQVDSTGKKIKRKFYLETNKKDNDKKIEIRKKFMYAKVPVGRVIFEFLNGTLIGISFDIGNRLISQRSKEYEGYIYYETQPWVSIPEEFLSDTFSFLKDAMVERYNFKYKEMYKWKKENGSDVEYYYPDYLLVKIYDGLGGQGEGQIYLSEDLSKSLTFKYSRTFDKNIQAGTIKLLDKKEMDRYNAEIMTNKLSDYDKAKKNLLD